MLPLSATATGMAERRAAASTEGRCSESSSDPFQFRIRMPADGDAVLIGGPARPRPSPQPAGGAHRRGDPPGRGRAYAGHLLPDLRQLPLQPPRLAPSAPRPRAPRRSPLCDARAGRSRRRTAIGARPPRAADSWRRARRRPAGPGYPGCPSRRPRRAVGTLEPPPVMSLEEGQDRLESPDERVVLDDRRRGRAGRPGGPRGREDPASASARSPRGVPLVRRPAPSGSASPGRERSHPGPLCSPCATRASSLRLLRRGR